MLFMEDEIREVLNELRTIKIDIQFIKQNMPDKEMFLTAGEERLLEESHVNEKNKELVSSQTLRKNLGI